MTQIGKEKHLFCQDNNVPRRSRLDAWWGTVLLSPSGMILGTSMLAVSLPIVVASSFLPSGTQLSLRSRASAGCCFLTGSTPETSWIVSTVIRVSVMHHLQSWIKESRNHLFFQCLFSQDCWASLGGNSLAQWFRMANLPLQTPALQKSSSRLVDIWKQRNALIFNQIPASRASWLLNFKEDLLSQSIRLMARKQPFSSGLFQSPLCLKLGVLSRTFR